MLHSVVLRPCDACITRYVVLRPSPQGALHAAHMRTKVAGSSTACVMQLDQAKRMLVAANLVRNGGAEGVYSCQGDWSRLPKHAKGGLPVQYWAEGSHSPC